MWGWDTKYSIVVGIDTFYIYLHDLTYAIQHIKCTLYTEKYVARNGLYTVHRTQYKFNLETLGTRQFYSIATITTRRNELSYMYVELTQLPLRTVQYIERRQQSTMGWSFERCHVVAKIVASAQL